MSGQDESAVDPLPGLIAAIDQFAGEARHLARVKKAMFDALLEEGFTEGQALVLVANFPPAEGSEL